MEDNVIYSKKYDQISQEDRTTINVYRKFINVLMNGDKK